MVSDLLGQYEGMMRLPLVWLPCLPLSSPRSLHREAESIDIMFQFKLVTFGGNQVTVLHSGCTAGDCPNSIRALDNACA